MLERLFQLFERLVVAQEAIAKANNSTTAAPSTSPKISTTPETQQPATSRYASLDRAALVALCETRGIVHKARRDTTLIIELERFDGLQAVQAPAPAPEPEKVADPELDPFSDPVVEDPFAVDPPAPVVITKEMCLQAMRDACIKRTDGSIDNTPVIEALASFGAKTLGQLGEDKFAEFHEYLTKGVTC